MGQKTNPISLRVGTKKNWKTEFSEKRTRDFGIAYSLETSIITFLKSFLKLRSFCLQDYRLVHQENSLKIFLSIFSLPTARKAFPPKNDQNAKKLLQTVSSELPPKLLLTSRNYTSLTAEFWLQKIAQSISKFLEGKKVTLIVSYANKNLNLKDTDKKELKKKILALRKYKKQAFFIKGIDTSLAAAKNPSFATVLLGIVVKYVKAGEKGLKFFVRFLAKSLELLIKTPQHSTSGVKLKINGRINGANRARALNMLVGDVPCHTYDVNLEYVSASTQNKNGSYGIKLWVVAKPKQ